VLGVIGLVVIALLGVVFSSWRTIEPGYVGIVFDKAHHQVTNTIDPGWVLINPLTQSITRYPVGIQTLVMVRADQEGVIQGDDSVRVGSREGQMLFADVSVQYSVARDQAAALYQVWAGAPIERIEDNLVRQITRAVLSDVASTYVWEDLYGPKRVEYTHKVSAELQRRFAVRFVTFESLNLRGWHLPENLQQALDAKIAAQQAAEQQAFALQQAQMKAEQDVTEATGRANALKAQAEGEAAAITIRAQADADANRLLGGSLTPDLIDYQQVQRWDGKLPVATGPSSPPRPTQTAPMRGTAR
jgi:regulator of protease activity HflC (stomatin/prohibitin superfamily)